MIRIENRGSEFLAAVGNFKFVKFGVGRGQAFRAGLGLLFLASVFDVVQQLFVSVVAADAFVFALAEFDGAHGGEVLGVLGHFNQIFGLCAVGNFDFALLPHAGNVGLPGFAHAFDEAVRASKKEDVRT